MSASYNSIITGSGRFIPGNVIKNSSFLQHNFFDNTGNKLDSANETIIEKFHSITGISERRYSDEEHRTSDLAYFAAAEAIASAGINKEELDYIIVAHNFGDVTSGRPGVDLVPTMAARVKNLLRIENPYCVAFDLPFGCPGWLQAVIHANYFIRSGDAKKVLVVGAETLSRVSDPHDRDSMIYSDGAGAVIVERNTTGKGGILNHLTRSDTLEHAYLLKMESSYNSSIPGSNTYLKMEGRKLYEFALKTVPQLVKDCIDKAGLTLTDIKKVLIHQANEKMDEAILQRLFKLYGISEIPSGIMPMTISLLGNNSVATLPVLYDMIVKNEMEGQSLNSGDYIVMASIGAGMNSNAIVYQVP